MYNMYNMSNLQDIYIRVDIKLWIFLQNIILLPSEYLIETDEYEFFSESEKTHGKYVLSSNDIYYEAKHRTCLRNQDIFFESFAHMIDILKQLLDNDSMKQKLITTAIPIIERIIIEDRLQSFTI